MNILFKVLVIVMTVALFACSPEQGQLSEQNSQPESDLETMNPISPGAEEQVAAKPNCTFRLGFDVWEPYQYVDVDGDVRGFDIELIESVLQDMNCDITFIQGTWVSLLDDLRDGDVDMLLGASRTESREQFAYFSEPYRAEEFSLYIRKDDETRAGYSDIDAFIENGSRIGVVGEYYYGPRITILQDGKGTAQYFVPGIMGELNIGRLLDMDIDGYLEDSFVGASMLRRKGLSNYIVAHGYTIQTGDIYVMFSKQSVDQSDVEQFNEHLNELKDSPKYDTLVRKYSR